MSRDQTSAVGVLGGPGSQRKPIFKPIFGKVVIHIDGNPERKHGLLHLPQRGAERSSIGTIVATYEPVTDERGTLIECAVKIGQTVLFGQFTGTLIKVANENYVICREHDLLTGIEYEGDDVEEVVGGDTED